MEEIVRWLRQVEKLACSVYSGLAGAFAASDQLGPFFARMADDESTHCRLMEAAAKLLSELRSPPEAAIAVDAKTRARVEAPFRLALAKLREGHLTEQVALEMMLEAEFTEWNDVFVYVITALQRFSTSFQSTAATIQNHQNRIEDLVSALPASLKPTRDPRQLPRIWEHRFLVVDDDPSVRKILELLLARQGEVETASDGQEALAKIRTTFFDAVVADVKMPLINGLELLRQAQDFDESITERFVLLTGTLAEETEDILTRKGVTVLRKPAGVTEISAAIQKVRCDGR